MRGLKLEQIHLESGSFPFDNGLVQFSKRETDDSDKKDVIYKVIDLGASDSIKKIDLDRSIISVNTNGDTIDLVFKKLKTEHNPEQYDQHHKERSQVSSRHHAAVPQNRNKHHGQQKLYKCDQLPG